MNKRLSQMIAAKLIALLLVACGASATSTPVPTPTPIPVSISGRARSTDSPPQPASDRKIVLCLVKEVVHKEGDPWVKASCVLDADLTTVTDSAGHFEFRGVPDGSYMFLYDDSVEDFETGLVEWDEKVVKLLDADWSNQFEDARGHLPTDEMIFTEMLNLTNPVAASFLTTYAKAIEGFPFLVGIKIDRKAEAFTPVIVEVKAGETAQVDIEVFGSKK